SMDTRDRASLNDILRTLDVPLVEGSRLRWTSPTGLALVLARWISAEGRVRSLWIDAPTEADAAALAHELSVLLPETGVAYFPGFSPFVGGESSPPGIVLQDRLSTLIGLLEHRVQVLVSGPLAALEKLPHPSWFEKQRLELRKGAEVPRELLLETLTELGFHRTDLAGSPGEFSARGLVVDIWPDHLADPLRLEFFGDELERLCAFDSDTQRRTGIELDSLTVYPRYEGRRSDPRRLMKAVESRASLTPDPGDDLAFRRARLASHGRFPGEELFYPLLDQPAGQLAHWVPPCLRVQLEPEWAGALRERERARTQAGLETLRRGGVVCPEFEDRFLGKDPSRPTVILTEFQSEADTPLHAQPVREFQGRLGELADHLRELLASGHRIFLAGSTSGMRDRLGEFLQEYELPVSHGTEPGCRGVHLPLGAGAHLKEARLLLLTEREVFGRKAMAPPPKKSRVSAFLSDLRDLKPGDRVVHMDHGIGEYLGLGVLTVAGEEHEVVQLRYADNGRINVSLERADLIQRYISPDGTLPPLDKLGGATWTKVKRRAKKAIRDMAEELLKLYAKRKAEKGFAYSVDGPEMAEFDASFPYELTADQAEAIEAVKADLESERPMDRLLCGDVGYGKTEVAMRAAAKVALDGKQVAILCPTTVLCFQHFRT
ncbi:MAG TPA: CarD family transcriptional regulator, partial [Holophaga sp.]|nr:CarD family transcriptional regulator [Holophaga sp.]